MKKINYFLIFSFSVLFTIISNDLSAQETISGTVKYKQTTKFDFSNIQGPRRDSQRFKDFVASAPEEGNFAYILNFSGEKALYKENDEEMAAVDPNVQRAMHIMSMTSSPTAKLVQVFYNFEKNKKIEQREFMTRYFIVETEIDAKAWKMGMERKKILDYICMSAEMDVEGQVVKAWFTPQIPISVGPDQYTGLPGLVLAVEKNGATIYLATSVDLTEPQKEDVSRPKEGSKVSQEELDKIIAEKIEEFKNNPQRGPGRGHGGGGGRR